MANTQKGDVAMEKALIAMSGGVDSSVAAYLMQQAFACSGATMRLWNSQQDHTQDAQDVAARLGMDFHIFDCTADFCRNVVEKFIACYEQGGTPNPCIDCNRTMKFGLLLEKALSMGYDTIATGHYAKTQSDPATGRYLLIRAEDSAKDQTYFLSCLTQEQLAHIQFPLGALNKAEVRQIAEAQGFLNARKQDSQDICFIPDGDYLAFIKQYTGKEYPTGDYLDLSGKVIGKHTGAVGYTIGQRKGLGLAMGQPVYVCAKDMESNTVTVGSNEDLFRTTLRANNWNWISIPALTGPLRVTAKIRYRHTEQPATVYPEKNGFARVEFDQPQRAITTGQAVVLYDGNIVVGGGTITEVL